jgi:hypothetical protein
MAGESINGITMSALVAAKKKTITYGDVLAMRIKVEQTVRDCIKKTMK